MTKQTRGVQARLAEATGKDPTFISKLKKQGRLPLNKKGEIDFDKAVLYIKNQDLKLVPLQGHIQSESEEKLEVRYQRAKVKNEEEEGKLKELKRRELERDLVKVSEVVETLQDFAVYIRSKFLEIPENLTPDLVSDLGLDFESGQRAKILVENHINRILDQAQELAEEIKEKIDAE